ncbi:hypothetical protein [Telluribacter sp. SYSU D00476]|uniref:hypothetical protein n=1 Tax=Telluribacter sp. SYSU D00476 TaxID=2811430 RepID=UPI001FF42CE2|nr:hypothetical protein [Telluribacter sp. SYSU D00476]
MSQVIQTVPEDQISPKEIVLKVVAFKNTLLRNWKILLLFIVLGAGIGYVLDIYMKKPATYEATVVFNLGGGSSGPANEMAGLLGLGGGAPDANIFTGENFFYFVTSRPVIERALMKEVDVYGQKILFANFYIDSSGIKKDWEEAEAKDLINFRFTTNDLEKLSLQERLVLNQIVERTKGATTVASLDRKSSFTQLTTNSQNSTLAKTWANTLLETVEEVYTENQTFKTRKTLRLLQRRADSLAVILGRTEARLAREMDYSTQIVVPEGKVSVNKLERNTTFIQGLYMETMRNVENTRVSLIREAPLFTIIEPVKSPLDMNIDTGQRMKVGLLIGFVFGLFFIYIKDVYANVMADPRV